MVEPVWHLPDDSGRFAAGDDDAVDFLIKPEYKLVVNDTTSAMVASGIPHNLRRQVSSIGLSTLVVCTSFSFSG